MKLQTSEIPFDLDHSLVSRIPDLKEIRARIGLGESVSDESWRASTAYTWQIAGRQVLGNVAARQGFELDVRGDVAKLRSAIVEPIRSLIELTGVADVFSEFDDMISDAALSLGMSVAEVIPVVKAVVKLAFAVGKAVRQAIQTAKAYDTPQPQLIEPVSFSPRADEDLYNLRLLAPVNRTNDWTGIFSPPGLGLRMGRNPWEQPFLIKSTVAPGFQGARHGAQILAADVGQDGWLGCVPGTGVKGRPPQLHEGFQFDVAGMRDTGDYYMTPRNEAPGLWQTVSNPATPAMFAVDAKTVIQRWEAYLQNLWQWARDTDNRYVSPEMRKEIQRWCSENFGMAERKTEYGVPGSHVVESAAILLRNQESALDDPVRCAYVDQTFGAIASNDWLRTKWERGRRRLVEGDLLASKVDMDLVAAHGAEGFQFKVALQRVRSEQDPNVAAKLPRMAIDFERPKGAEETSGIGAAGIALLAAGTTAAYFLNRKKG